MQKIKTFWSAYHNQIILFLWALGAFIIAYRRSLWGDEWNHVQDLKNGLFWATGELLNKPSPFIPGEAVLNWFAKMIVTAFHGPEEVWARAQEIGWAVATLAIALNLSEEDRRERYLPWFIAFSVALISLATEMRPYASLFCSGAMATKILVDGRIKGRSMNILVWCFMLFGHLYGICFIILSLFLTKQIRKEILKVVTGIAMVALVLIKVKIVKGQGGAYTSYHFIEIFRQTLGTLSNPHKTIIIFLPLFIFGLYRLYKENRELTHRLLLFLAVAILGPIYSTISAKYFFIPRQIVGGAFPFLFLASLGLDSFSKILKRFEISNLEKSLPLFICLLISVVPWTLSTILKKPPFVDQPMHRYREVAQELAHGRWKNILDVDMCNVGPLKDYIEKITGETFSQDIRITFQGYAMGRSCLGSRFCMSWPTDWVFCSVGPSAYETGGIGEKLVSTPQFDLIVHSLIEPFPKLNRHVDVIRAW